MEEQVGIGSAVQIYNQIPLPWMCSLVYWLSLGSAEPLIRTYIQELFRRICPSMPCSLNLRTESSRQWIGSGLMRRFRFGYWVMED